MGGREPGWQSPPLLAAVRHGPAEHVLDRTPAHAGSDHGSGGRIAASLTSLPHRHAVHGRGGHVGPVVFAYDGSDLAKAAIAEAGRQLPAKRDALVLTVWKTFNVGFLPEPGAKFDAACADEVKHAAEQTAMHGASLAGAAGFRAQASAVEGTPTWKAIVDTADDHQASLIVLGSRGRAGLGLVAGSVAGAVASRSLRPVLIVGGRDGAPTPETSASATASEAVHNEVLK
jgi:nucleotide-binding universal stress UspA family protein